MNNKDILKILKNKLDLHGEGDIVIISKKGELDNPKAPKIKIKVTEDEFDTLAKEFHDSEIQLEAFEEQMDFLAKDEQEAIEGYEEVIGVVEDEHVKEQLEKILVEEKVHLAFLEQVKQDPSVNYEEPLPEQAVETLDLEWME